MQVLDISRYSSTLRVSAGMEQATVKYNNGRGFISLNPGFRLLFLLLPLCLSACVTAPTAPTTPSGRCLALFADIDRSVELARVRDQGPVPVEGFPFLRANRFLASFKDQLADEQQFASWVGYLAQLDTVAREFELRNLVPDADKRPDAWRPGRLEHCRKLLVQDLLADSLQRQKLIAAVRVPDDYVTAWRVAGLYPLTAPFVSMGVDRWHHQSHKVFSEPISALPIVGQLGRWRSPGAPVAAVTWSQTDPLGIPVLTPDQLGALFRYHAPIWEIDVVDDNDLPGTAVWRAGPAIDTTRGTQYETLSYTRYGDYVLVQLNYIIWFAARPGDDIYAGRFDGLVWRVTLGPDGEPWLYDSIHNCGCYHTFIPTGHLRLRDDLPTLYFEPPLVPQSAPAPPLVLRVSAGEHFLQRVYRLEGRSDVGGTTNSAKPVQMLQVADYSSLRSVPDGVGYRSFFGDHALVPGSERAERLLLWPMGVRSAGAMRQWGHHAVAFVGRRHFDDARLIESLFERTDR